MTFAVSDNPASTCQFKEFFLYFHHKEKLLGFGARFLIEYIMESPDVFGSHFVCLDGSFAMQVITACRLSNNTVHVY